MLFLMMMMMMMMLNLNVIHLNTFHLLLNLVNFQFSDSARIAVVSLSHANEDMRSYHPTNQLHQPHMKTAITN